MLSYVENNYVEPVDEQQLMYGAIKGMLDTLDPHTVFMPPDVFKEMKIDTSGEFGGLGIEIAQQERRHHRDGADRRHAGAARGHPARAIRSSKIDDEITTDDGPDAGDPEDARARRARR